MTGCAGYGNLGLANRSYWLADTVSAIGLFAVPDAMNGDGIFSFIEEHAVVADAKASQPLELAAQRLDIPLAGLGVVVEALQNAQCRLLLDRADFFPDVRLEADSLHAEFIRPCGCGSGPW